MNINSNNPAKTFEFYKRLGFKVLEEREPDDTWYGEQA
jgi:ribosomal protein S18 acetylase RimI-like enzyme